MASKNEVDNSKHVRGLIYFVKYSAAGYSGRRYNSPEHVYLSLSWLNENCMTGQWRQTTVRAHPGEWFRVPVGARNKQTAVVKSQTRDQ